MVIRVIKHIAPITKIPLKTFDFLYSGIEYNISAKGFNSQPILSTM